MLITKYKVKLAIQKLVEKSVKSSVIAQSQFTEFIELLGNLAQSYQTGCTNSIAQLKSTYASLHLEDSSEEQKYFQIMQYFEFILDDSTMFKFLREIFNV